MFYVMSIALILFNIFACTTMPYHIYTFLDVSFEYASMAYMLVFFVGNIILVHFNPGLPTKKQKR